MDSQRALNPVGQGVRDDGKEKEKCQAPERKPTRIGDEDVDDDDDSPIPVDKGWAWMVVVGCFGMHVLVVGGVKSFGVLFVELQQRFDVTASELGVLHGLASVLMMGLGPVSNALSVRYSSRAVVFAGGLLMGCGFVTSALVPSFHWLYLTYSTLTGLGSALAYAPSVVMVGHHFTRRRALANGISVSGSAVGSFVLPNLMRHLLNQYGLRGALALIGALMLHVCLCAALYRPFSSYLLLDRCAPLTPGETTTKDINGHPLPHQKPEADGPECIMGDSKIRKRKQGIVYKTDTAVLDKALLEKTGSDVSDWEMAGRDDLPLVSPGHQEVRAMSNASAERSESSLGTNQSKATKETAGSVFAVGQSGNTRVLPLSQHTPKISLSEPGFAGNELRTEDANFSLNLSVEADTTFCQTSVVNIEHDDNVVVEGAFRDYQLLKSSAESSQLIENHVQEAASESSQISSATHHSSIEERLKKISLVSHAPSDEFFRHSPDESRQFLGDVKHVDWHVEKEILVRKSSDELSFQSRFLESGLEQEDNAGTGSGFRSSDINTDLAERAPLNIPHADSQMPSLRERVIDFLNRSQDCSLEETPISPRSGDQEPTPDNILPDSYTSSRFVYPPPCREVLSEVVTVPTEFADDQSPLTVEKNEALFRPIPSINRIDNSSNSPDISIRSLSPHPDSNPNSLHDDLRRSPNSEILRNTRFSMTSAGSDELKAFWSRSPNLEDQRCRSPLKDELRAKSPNLEDYRNKSPNLEVVLNICRSAGPDGFDDLRSKSPNLDVTQELRRSPSPDGLRKSPVFERLQGKARNAQLPLVGDLRRSPSPTPGLERSSENCPQSPLAAHRSWEPHHRMATAMNDHPPSLSLAHKGEATPGPELTLSMIRKSLERKLARNSSVNSMITQFGSMKRSTRSSSDSDKAASFALNLRQDSGNSQPASGSLKRRAFKGGHPTLERHPSALWDARLPEGLRQALEEERQALEEERQRERELRQEQQGECIEMGRVGPEDPTSSSPAHDAVPEARSKSGGRLGSFKALDHMPKPLRLLADRKKTLLASNLRYRSETRDVGVASSPGLKANEKAPLKRFFSESQPSPPIPHYESFLHRRVRQISEVESWKSDSSAFASAGDLALASLQNISESLKEGDDDVFSVTSQRSKLTGLLRLSSQTLRKGKTKRMSVPLFDVTLLTNPVFLVFLLSLVCMNFGYPNVFVMLPSFCQEVGLDKTTSAFMVSIIGVTDLVGRIFIGWLSDLRLFPRKYGFMAALFGAGVLCVLLPKMKTYSGLVAFSCGFGFCGGCFVALIAVILVDFLGKDKLASSFGLASMAMAIGIMVGPPLYGDIRDRAQSWELAFVVAGLMSICAAACILIEPLAQNLVRRSMAAATRHAVLPEEEML